MIEPGGHGQGNKPVTQNGIVNIQKDEISSAALFGKYNHTNIRLSRNFGSIKTLRGESKPMEQFLNAYIGRMRPLFTGISESTAHELASAFLAFKFGLYANAARECDHALAHITQGDANSALRKAILIVRANALDRDVSQVTADLSQVFSEAERPFVAIAIPPEKNEDPATLELDNALILVYTVSLIRSADDEQALDEHRNFIIRMLTGYKKAMGFE